ncbi:MAG: beta-lactamase hydrolase domain-containing protein [Candidatus Binatia bacterium]
MGNWMKISDQLTVGPQPSEDQLEELPRSGFKAVVNLRTAGEPEQPLSPIEEGVKVRALGMDYFHIPVSPQNLRSEQVDRFREELGRLRKPAFVHCYTGKRAGAFSMIHAAIELGWTGEETLRKAGEMGFECNVPALKEFVRGYIDRNRT